MSERKINLNDIFNKYNSEGIVPNLPGIVNLDFFKNPIQMMMLDFGKQLLELASKNANLSISSRGVETYFDNFYSGVDSVEVNEQSILDTINQVG